MMMLNSNGAMRVVQSKDVMTVEGSSLEGWYKVSFFDCDGSVQYWSSVWRLDVKVWSTQIGGCRQSSECSTDDVGPTHSFEVG